MKRGGVATKGNVTDTYDFVARRILRSCWYVGSVFGTAGVAFSTPKLLQAERTHTSAGRRTGRNGAWSLAFRGKTDYDQSSLKIIKASEVLVLFSELTASQTNKAGGYAHAEKPCDRFDESPYMPTIMPALLIPNVFP